MESLHDYSYCYFNFQSLFDTVNSSASFPLIRQTNALQPDKTVFFFISLRSVIAGNVFKNKKSFPYYLAKTSDAFDVTPLVKPSSAWCFNRPVCLSEYMILI